MKIAVLGGTGHLGSGLAWRWAMAGLAVIIGSRDAARAQASAAALADEVRARGRTAQVEGLANIDAARQADVVVLTTPFATQRAALEEVREALAGKLLIDATVPLVPPRVARVQLPAEGSAAQIAAGIVGPEVRVVSAFHNVAADRLKEEGAIDCDILVFGDDKEARAQAVKLVEAAGLRGLHGGALANSAAAEAFTSVLIFMNKQYGGHGGIQITGLEQAPASA